ncbi:MAG: hypothetical protein R3F65_22645 [bacterium]
MQIALIGASGATGRHVCRLARAAGHTVRAYSRTGRPLEGQDVANHPLDATDPDAAGASKSAASAGPSSARPAWSTAKRPANTVTAPTP